MKPVENYVIETILYFTGVVYQLQIRKWIRVQELLSYKCIMLNLTSEDSLTHAVLYLVLVTKQNKIIHFLWPWHKSIIMMSFKSVIIVARHTLIKICLNELTIIKRWLLGFDHSRTESWVISGFAELLCFLNCKYEPSNTHHWLLKLYPCAVMSFQTQHSINVDIDVHVVIGQI